MRTPTLRTSRPMRTQLAKRKTAPARDIVIDRKGLIIDGQRSSLMVGAEVDIHRYGGKHNVVSIDVLAETVTVRPPFGRHVVITERWG